MTRFFLLVGISFFLAGCSSEPLPPPMDSTAKRIALLSSVYMTACTQLGRAPTGMEELRPCFPASAGSFEDGCKSERDGQPFQLPWGFDIRGPQEKLWIVAWEHTGAGGKRYAADMMQSVTEIPATEFSQLPFPPGYAPKP